MIKSTKNFYIFYENPLIFSIVRVQVPLSPKKNKIPMKLEIFLLNSKNSFFLVLKLFVLRKSKFKKQTFFSWLKEKKIKNNFKKSNFFFQKIFKTFEKNERNPKTHFLGFFKVFLKIQKSLKNFKLNKKISIENEL